ncbi:uncharacterized protein [Temnothorax nylanderi]|uniref:uncharacterized protein n=1 Tax=Temnothorax nylanderi TaxID=102681 RepID=UPI003A88EE57
MVLLAEGEDKMRSMIERLERYLDKKRLELNAQKTKIMRFRKGSGYTLQRNGGQEAHVKERVRKAAVVMGQVWEIGKRRFGKDWGRRIWLFDKLVWTEPVVIIGDFNAKVGKVEEAHLRSTGGTFGLGVRNERGERLIQFAVENDLAIMNTMFQHHPRRLSTWISPNKEYRNQIDYMIIKKRWKTSIRNVKAKPGADCDSDHKLLLGAFSIKLHFLKRGKKQEMTRIGNMEAFQQNLMDNANWRRSDDPNKCWENIKEWIGGAVRESGAIEIRKKKHWMTDATLQLVEERRRIRGSLGNTGNADNADRLRRISQQIKQACNQDKNNFLKNICSDIERHAERHESHELFKTVKYLTKEFKPQTQVIKDEQGTKITDPKGIAETWRQYCTNLYRDEHSQVGPPCGPHEHLEPPILRSEVEKAIGQLKKGKSPGADGITAEVIKAMGQAGIDTMLELCNVIWRTGKWPDDWRHSTFVPIYKKGSPTECSNYRTVALIPHASKIFLHVLHNRLKCFLLPEIAEEQCGFIPGKDTREQILNVRQIVEKAREFNVRLCRLHQGVRLSEMDTPLDHSDGNGSTAAPGGTCAEPL